MNREQFCRTALLLGEDEVLKLEKKMGSSFWSWRSWRICGRGIS